MSLNISINDYCCNRQLYKDKLDDEKIKYYNAICDASTDKQSCGGGGKTSKPPVTPSPGDEGSKKPTPDEIATSIIQGMLSPNGILMLSGFVGFSMSKKFIKQCIQNTMKLFLEKNIKDFAQLGFTKYPEALLNETIISKSCLDGVIKEAGYLAGTRYLALSSVKALAMGFDWITEILNGFMLIGMIVDLWDPCDLKTQKMGADALNNFSDLWDKIADAGFQKAHSVPTSEGQFISQYYGVDYNEFGITSNTLQTYNFIMDNLLPDQKDFYENKQHEYYLDYKNNLRYNSEGMPIYWPPNEPPLNSSNINSISNTIDNFLSDNNTVVTNWFYKFLPIIIACIIFLFFIFFLIKYG